MISLLADVDSVASILWGCGVVFACVQVFGDVNLGKTIGVTACLGNFVFVI